MNFHLYTSRVYWAWRHQAPTRVILVRAWRCQAPLGLLLNYHRQKYSVGINHRYGRTITQVVVISYSQGECQHVSGRRRGESGVDGTVDAKGDAHPARLHPRICQVADIRIAAA